MKTYLAISTCKKDHIDLKGEVLIVVEGHQDVLAPIKGTAWAEVHIELDG